MVGILLAGLIGGYMVGTTSGGVLSSTEKCSQGAVVMDDHGMSDAMGDMMSGLSGKTGEQFEQAFLAEMIEHHEGAVAMARELLKNTQRPELVKMGNDIISVQTKEVDMMKEWQRSWFAR